MEDRLSLARAVFVSFRQTDTMKMDAQDGPQRNRFIIASELRGVLCLVMRLNKGELPDSS